MPRRPSHNLGPCRLTAVGHIHGAPRRITHAGSMHARGTNKTNVTSSTMATFSVSAAHSFAILYAVSDILLDCQQRPWFFTMETTEKHSDTRDAFMRHISNDANRFGDVDLDGNQKLDFEEFLAMQPKVLRAQYSSDEIHEWFKVADLDGNGELSMNEFFAWSMNNAINKLGGHGKSQIEDCFKRRDLNGSGSLDVYEFSELCRALGFGAVAHEIFAQIDKNGSGAIS